MKKLFCLLAALALLAKPLRAEAAAQRYLALTFDDGPSGELTERLLEGLAERQVRVTFFVCGYRIAEFPDTLSHIAAAGHEIGLHSSNHDYMQKMDYGTALRDLTGCAKAVADACGALVHVVDTVHPEPTLAAKYEEQYQKFRKIYPACKALFAELA